MEGAAQAEDRVRVTEAAMRRLCTELLEHLDVAEDDAAIVADVFIQAELMGEESHGLRLFLQVLGRLEAGGDRAATSITTVMDRGAVAVWDANRSLGQVTAAHAMALAVEKARLHGIGLVSVRNGNSLTSAKYYALMAARQGMVGLVYTNTSRKMMPPPGGRTPVLGNNPFAAAAPAGRFGAFVLDMASTAAAIERIVRAKELGETIPQGWALDRDGQPATDPARALESMALLPFGGHKAFGLAMVHEILTSVLNGGLIFAGQSTGFLPYGDPMNTSFTPRRHRYFRLSGGRGVRAANGDVSGGRQGVRADLARRPSPLPRRALARRIRTSAEGGDPAAPLDADAASGMGLDGFGWPIRAGFA